MSPLERRAYWWHHGELAPAPEPVPPPGGWRKPICTFGSHLWELEVEDGRAHLGCTDPCDARLFDPSVPTPVCLVDWRPEDIAMDIPVRVTFVDDFTPYGYYLLVRPA